MIFDRSDREALFRTEVRKACESAMVTTRDDISPARKQMISKQLLMEVNRCHAMVRIADNDLSNIREDAAIMDEETLHLPLDVYDDYMKVMKEQDREDEGYYTFLYTYFLGYLEHIREGIRISDLILEGGNPVGEKEMIRLMKVRTILEGCRDRCSELMDEGAEGDVPYARAMEVIECNLEEISIMLRIGSGREIDIDEISLHLEWAETIDQDPFRKLFLIDMEHDDRQLFTDYDRAWESRVRIMLGRCIADTELGA